MAIDSKREKFTQWKVIMQIDVFHHVENFSIEPILNRVCVHTCVFPTVDSHEDSKRYHHGFHFARSFTIIVPSRLNYRSSIGNWEFIAFPWEVNFVTHEHA